MTLSSGNHWQRPAGGIISKNYFVLWEGIKAHVKLWMLEYPSDALTDFWWGQGQRLIRPFLRKALYWTEVYLFTLKGIALVKS